MFYKIAVNNILSGFGAKDLDEAKKIMEQVRRTRPTLRPMRILKTEQGKFPVEVYREDNTTNLYFNGQTVVNSHTSNLLRSNRKTPIGGAIGGL